MKLIQTFSGQRVALNHMNLDELSNVASANLRIGSVAREEFRQRYKNYAVVLLSAEDVTDEVKKFHIYENATLIEINDYELARRVLRNFGNVIRRLEIVSQNIQSDRLKEIIEIAKEYASESMSHL